MSILTTCDSSSFCVCMSEHIIHVTWWHTCSLLAASSIILTCCNKNTSRQMSVFIFYSLLRHPSAEMQWPTIFGLGNSSMSPFRDHPLPHWETCFSLSCLFHISNPTQTMLVQTGTRLQSLMHVKTCHHLNLLFSHR